MPIVRDAISFDLINPGTQLTISHVNNGNLLVVGVGANNNNDIITGITYAGSAMTRAGVGIIAANNISAYMYYLLNPSTGTNNIVISSGSSVLFQGEGVSYTGARQTPQPDASTGTTITSGTSAANTLTTVADNSVHLAFYYVSASNPTSVTNGSILQSQFMAESSPLLVTPAASHVMTGNGGTQNWAVVGASFAPPTGGFMNTISKKW